MKPLITIVEHDVAGLSEFGHARIRCSVVNGNFLSDRVVAPHIFTLIYNKNKKGYIITRNVRK